LGFSAAWYRQQEDVDHSQEGGGLGLGFGNKGLEFRVWGRGLGLRDQALRRGVSGVDLPCLRRDTGGKGDLPPQERQGSGGWRRHVSNLVRY